MGRCGTTAPPRRSRPPAPPPWPEHRGRLPRRRAGHDARVGAVPAARVTHGGRMTNFAHELQAAVAEAPDRPAVRLDDLVLDYATLDAAVARAAGVLRDRGVEAGDRVGLQMPNVPYFPVIYYGALRLGAVVVPMNPLLKEREVAFHLSDSGARLLLAWHGFAAAAQAGAGEADAECILVAPG